MSFLTENFFYFFIALTVLVIVLVCWVYIIWSRNKKIFKGESGDLEKVLLNIREQEEDVVDVLEKIEKRLINLERELPKDIRKVGLVRFNPFSDAGGDQSFALALLNDEKDGIVLSSLYGREINRVYAKPIEKGTSKYQLSAEEKQAIEEAR